MSEEQQPKEPISFEKIGGLKVGHPVPVRTETPIDFSSIGGKCVRKASDNATVVTAVTFDYPKPPKSS
jgi:hypothetical protein